MYNRSRGELGKLVKAIFPTEDENYYNIMMKLYNDEALPGVV